MIIGYARVSTIDQNLDRQFDQLNEYGCARIFSEKVSGAKVIRAELEKMIDQLRENDVVVVTELSRLSRSVKDLFAVVDKIHAKGANVKSLRENWVDTTTAQGKLLFTIFAGISEFERDLIRQRVNEGLTAARARGRNGGRPRVASHKSELALKMYDSQDYSVNEILTATGISKPTLYKYIRERKGEKNNEN